MVTFTTRRSKPELVAPRRATPQGCKPLSDVDDQWELRRYQTIVEFFRIDVLHHGCHKPDDPAKAIKAAVAEALVYYYPVAGRLRETPRGKLVVECTGDGVVFVEADADVRLEDLGQPLLVLPYPCIEELLCDVGEIGDVIGKPLLFMQVTRLKCGGFVIGLRMCGNIVDDIGMVQIMKAIVDLTDGKARPTVLPVWEREVLTTYIPPRITYTYPAHEPFLDTSDGTIDDVMLSTPLENMVSRCFLFGPREIASLQTHVPVHLRHSNTIFEVLTAVVWRCRTVALGYKPDQTVHLRFDTDARRRRGKHSIPQGYYGNDLLFYPIIETSVAELCTSQLSHTLEQMRKAARRFDVSGHGVESVLRMMAALRGKPPLTMGRVYFVRDVRHIGDDELSFAWAKRVGGGILATCGGDVRSRSVSQCMRCENDAGEDSVLVSMRLPREAMDRFAKQMDSWVNKHGETSITPSSL